MIEFTGFGIKLPCRQTLATTILDKVVQTHCADTNSIFKNCKFVALGLDCWSQHSGKGFAYLGVVAHVISNFQYKTILIASEQKELSADENGNYHSSTSITTNCFSLNKFLTGLCLTDLLTNVWKKFSQLKDKVKHITSDAAGPVFLPLT